MSLIVRALCAALVGVVLTAVAPSAGATAQEDWRFLYADGELRDGSGALRSNIPVSISIDFPAGRFSPDGKRLAVPDVRTLRVHKPDGTSTLLAKVANFYPRAVAWSPSGTQVAAVGRVVTPEDVDVRIYLFPVDGSTPTLVYSDTRLLRINESGGLSWNSADDRLAFIATEFMEGENGGDVAATQDTDQVWTVPAHAAATPSRYTGRPVCGDCSRAPNYDQPTWSPDGSRLAVESFVPFDFETQPFVGILAEGALAAEPLVDAPAEDQLAWSDDGEQLAFSVYDTSGDFYDETIVVDADNGALLRTVEDVIAPFVDWLPCPGGTCPVWQNVYAPPKPSLNIRGRAKMAKVIVSGEMFNVPAVTTVTVTLQKRIRAGARWRKVTRVQVRAVEGLFRKAFARPKAVRCRAIGTYTDGTSRATDQVTFRC